MSIRKFPQKRYIYLVIIIIVLLVIWAIWSANRISNNLNQLVIQDETDAIKKTVAHLAATHGSSVSPQTSEDATSYMLTQLDDDLKNIQGFPIHDFNDSLTVQVLGLNSVKADLSWSYKVDRLGWPIMTVHNSNELTAQDNPR